VYQGKEVSSEKKWALKFVQKSLLNDRQKRNIVREVNWNFFFFFFFSLLAITHCSISLSSLSLFYVISASLPIWIIICCLVFFAALAKIEIMKMLNHPNIIRLKESVETSEYFILVMELMKGGDLFDRLQQQQTFLEEDARGLMIQVASKTPLFPPIVPPL